ARRQRHLAEREPLDPLLLRARRPGRAQRARGRQRGASVQRERAGGRRRILSGAAVRSGPAQAAGGAGLIRSSPFCAAAAAGSPPATVTVGRAILMPLASNAFLIMA